LLRQCCAGLLCLSVSPVRFIASPAGGALARIRMGMKLDV